MGCVVHCFLALKRYQTTSYEVIDPSQEIVRHITPGTGRYVSLVFVRIKQNNVLISEL